MSAYLTKLVSLSRALKIERLNQQVREVLALNEDLQAKRVPEQAPQQLGFKPDEFALLAADLSPKRQEMLKISNHLLNSWRQFMSLHYGTWSLPNLQTAHLIKEKLKAQRSLEIMAGNGYWSLALARAGLNTTTTDSLTWAQTSRTGRRFFVPVCHFEASSAIRQFSNVDLIICSWAPNFGDGDWRAVQAWRRYNPAAHFLFVGEKQGVTNSAQFWRKVHLKHSAALAAINASFMSFDFINEKIFEIRQR